MLLTGASTGLGLAIARALLPTHHRLLLTARPSSLHRFRESGIEAGERVHLFPLDVTDDGQRAAVVAEADRRWGGVTVLINNAGISYRSVVEHVLEVDRMAQLDVNFRSPMELARRVLPAMRARHWGRIINVSSVGGMMAMPTMGVYSASKFALEGASESLWYEVRPFGIRVSLIQPGFIHSSSFQNVRFTNLSDLSSHDAADPYYRHYASMSPFIERMMSFSTSSPERVARVVVRTMHARRPPLRVPATPDAVFFAWMRRLLPRGMYHEALYRALPGIRSWGSRGTISPSITSPPTSPIGEGIVGDDADRDVSP